MASIAKSLSTLPQSRIRELAHIAMEMDGVTRLYFGESNLPTPDFIKEALSKAVHEGHTFYTANAGMNQLREAIADNYHRLHDVRLKPDNIVVTASGVQAINLSVRLVVDEGDEVIVLTPNWPNGSAIVQMYHGRPVEVPFALHEGEYKIDYERVVKAITPKTKAILYTSPSNPVGWTATVDDQDRLLEISRKNNLWLLVDEVYERIYYDAPVAPSILRRADPSDSVIVIQSFSKTYCMTGWRLGWVVAPKEVCLKGAQLNEFIVSHAASMIQIAAVTAIADGESYVRQMVDSLKQNRDYATAELQSMPGITLQKPRGAFYLFPRVEGIKDSFDFCRDLLKSKKVGLAPGNAFGVGGEGSIRICYASEKKVLEAGLAGLRDFLNKR